MSNCIFVLPNLILSDDVNSLFIIYGGVLFMYNVNISVSEKSSIYEYMFVCNINGSLLLNTLNIIESDKLYFKESLINVFVTSDANNFTNCSFNNIEGSNSNGSCINIYGNRKIENNEISSANNCADLVIDNCTFVNCSEKDVNTGGGGIYCDIIHNCMLNITDYAFKNCYARTLSGTGGKGGGIYLINNGLHQNFIINKVKFDNTEAFLGKHICIVSDDLCSIIANNTCPYLVNKVMSGNNDIGLENNNVETEKNGFYLSLFLLEVTSVYVNNSNEDVNLCGYMEYPCKTLLFVLNNYSLTNRGYRNKEKNVSIILMNECSTGGFICLSREGTFIKGGNEADTFSYIFNHNKNQNKKRTELFLNNTSGTNGLVLCEESATISSLSLVLPTFIDHDQPSIFRIAKDNIRELPDCNIETTLTISDISVICNNSKIDITVFRVEIGILNIESSEIKDMEFSYLPFIKAVGSSSLVVITLTNITNIKMEDNSESLQNFIKVENSSSFILFQCNINNISINTKNRSVMYGNMKSSCFLNVTNCTFDNDRSNLGDTEVGGGCFYLELFEKGRFLFNSSVLSNCCVSELKGKGRGIYLYLDSSSDDNYLIKNPLFKDNKARYGKNIYIHAYNLTKSVKQDNFDFEWSDELEILNNSLIGSDQNLFKDNYCDLPELWSYKNHTVFVAMEYLNGNDSLNCGGKDSPCLTIEMGFKHLEGNNLFLKFIREFTLNHEVTINSTTLTSSESDEYSIFNVNIEEKESNLNSTILKIEGVSSVIRLSFVFLDLYMTTSIVESNGDYLFIEECRFIQNFKTDRATEGSLINVNKGEVTLNKIVIISLSLKKTAIILSESCQKGTINCLSSSDTILTKCSLIESIINSSNEEVLTINTLIVHDFTVDKPVLDIFLKGEGSKNCCNCKITSSKIEKVSNSTNDHSCIMSIRSFSNRNEKNKDSSYIIISNSSFLCSSDGGKEMKGLGCNFINISLFTDSS